jgi:four helix bundle protein
MFDHEKLDIYQVSLDFVAWSYVLAKRLKGADRHARDQLLRASQSIPLNIAEGNGKRSMPDRKRFFQIACGSALECAAVLDVLFRCDVLSDEDRQFGKKLLCRVVSMLTKLTNTANCVREESGFYEPASADYEYRSVEQEYEK